MQYRNCNKGKTWPLNSKILWSMLNDLTSGSYISSNERFVKDEILRSTESLLDPMQFAYRPKRGVEDATVTLLHLLIRHLEGKGSHARVLFVDFSSAFNTIQPHVLIGRLLEELKLCIGMDLRLLTNRMQRLRINNTFSGQVTSSTGSPQGCVLSSSIVHTLHEYVSK